MILNIIESSDQRAQTGHETDQGHDFARFVLFPENIGSHDQRVRPPVFFQICRLHSQFFYLLPETTKNSDRRRHQVAREC